MDRLWTPWRYSYVSQAGSDAACIFCDKPARGRDEETLIVHRAEHTFVLLNLYPYTNGHMMIAPYAHVPTLGDASDAVLVEMMLLARQAERHLRSLYQPQGLNIGMNLGECAGAGVAGHIHLHVLPRWTGDASFMTTVAETRVMPEDLGQTWLKLSRAFQGKSA